MSSLFDPDREVPDDLKSGPFLSVFVVHGILDQKKYELYQDVSDSQSVKPSHFGGEVLGFSKPVFRFLGPEDVHAIAVIRWPNFCAFKAWRTQTVYKTPGLSDLHALAERETVYFLPCMSS